jgi:mannitol 2-dehydrogenase
MRAPPSNSGQPSKEDVLLQVSDTALPNPRVGFPTYERKGLSGGVAHIGVGGFHRAHQGVFFHQLAERSISTEWGVVGVGLRSASNRPALLTQDCHYAVLQRSPTEDRVEVVGSLLDYLHGPQDPAAVLAVLADPATKLVTLTVTGNGYGVDAGGRLELGHDFHHDLLHPGEPRTVLGYLTEALRRRRDIGVAPPTVLSCDNLIHNGDTARGAVVAFAALRDQRLADWIERNVAFPSSVVDRITPVTTAEHRHLLASEFGLTDACPVVCEQFSQWIVEDDFCAARPPLDEVGVEFVADVEPYERKKKRLLNGTHSALGYLGYLLGYRRLDEAIADPLLRRYAEGLMFEEVGPLLPGLGGADLAGYGRSLLSRFANPRISDRLQRLCARGSTKIPAYLLPSLSEAIEQGRPHTRLTLALAAWIRYLRGVDFEANRIEVKDPLKPDLQPLARKASHDLRPLLEVRSVFGDLAGDDDFVQQLEATLNHLDRYGPAAALDACLARDRLALVA